MALLRKDELSGFIFEPHTASRAITKAVLATGDWTEYQDHHNMLVGFSDTVKYCFIRNPFDVLVSKWRVGAHKDKTFREFFELRKHTPEVKRPLYDIYLNANILLYYESLPDSLKLIVPTAELDFDPKHKTPGKDKPYQEYYEPYMVDYLRREWEGFLEYHQYEFGTC